MALCPFAVKKLIPPGSSDPKITPRVAVLHVAATNAPSLYDFFKNRSGGIESHFYVLKDGTVEQYRDTSWEADAQYLANPFAVSIETQGLGTGTWTPEQLRSIKRLLLWLNLEHKDIALGRCGAWNGSGVGYHVMWGAPSAWTPFAKSCPGPDRVEQFNDLLVPWLRSVHHDYASRQTWRMKVLRGLYAKSVRKGQLERSEHLAAWIRSM